MSTKPLVGVTLESFEQLEKSLLNWRSFIDSSVYDVSGMMALFCACLHNLRDNATEAELDELKESLNDDERALLRHLSGCE